MANKLIVDWKEYNLIVEKLAIKIFTGKFTSTSPAIWVIAALSVASFYVA